MIGSNLGINSVITKESKKVNTAARLTTVLDKSEHLYKGRSI